jgi:hypothetical protein
MKIIQIALAVSPSDDVYLYGLDSDGNTYTQSWNENGNKCWSLVLPSATSPPDTSSES